MKITDKNKEPLGFIHPDERKFVPTGNYSGKNLITEHVPLSLRNKFKQTCVGRETMRTAVLRLIAFYIQSKGNIPGIPKNIRDLC